MVSVGLGKEQERSSVDAVHRAAADAVWSMLSSGYGPHGGHYLLDMGDEVQVLKSAASGLSEQALDAAMVPFQGVVRSVRSLVGDQATAAGLIASGLVRRGLHAESSGLPRPAILEGFGLARRQALAELQARSIRATPEDALATASGLGADVVRLIVEGLQEMAASQQQTVHLDDVDVRVENVDGPEWAAGTVAEPQHGPDQSRASDVGVLVVDKGWSIKPRQDGVSRRIRSADMLDASLQEEQAMRQGVLDRLLDLGVGLIACAGAVDESLCLDAARAGIWVWTDAPKDALRRLAASTAATAIPDLDHMEGPAIGRADVRRRPLRRGGYWVMGPAPSATLVLAAGLPNTQAAVADDGERLLRAAGAVMPDSRAVPGAGGWQRGIARSLRAAMPHAKGKTGLAVEAAAEVFDGMADALVRNAGGDPLDKQPPASGVMDATACVQCAVETGFDAAIAMLRIDGRYDKRPSTPEGLRGGSGPVGSPKGMPGDIPPLM